MTIPLNANTSNVIIVMITDIVKVHPLLLNQLGDRAKASFPNEKTIVAFVQEKNSPHGVQYTYLKMSDDRIRERYLYDPKRLELFKKKQQCNTLWHGCKAPTFKEIKHHAKLMRIGEEGRA